jgi:tungstate transport system substrate-binding protein
MMSKKMLTVLMMVVFVLGTLVGCAPTPSPISSEPSVQQDPTEAPLAEPTATTAPTVRAGTPGRLILATTTSTQDSGLLDVILPDFRQKFNIEVDVIAVGTGQALQLGKDGNADVLLVHARSQEDEFMDGGHGARREDVMYNDFVILGPEEDPAGIKGLTSAAEAFQKVADTGSTFISRGDKSGTHSKELSVWKKLEMEPSGGWYLSAGQGMGEVLTMTNEQQAYTLSDRATYLARTKQGINLIVLVEKDQILLNPYGVISVNPAKGPQINAALADQFVDWIISVPVQAMIADYGKAEFGQSLFVPDSELWRASQ